MNNYKLPNPHSHHYLSRYIKFINWIKSTNLISDTKENHHILPESMGGTNSFENRLDMTPRCHFLAHRMLWKAYKNKQMTAAFFAMCNQNNPYQNRERKITSREYARLKKQFVEDIRRSSLELWATEEFRQKHIDTNNTPKTKELRSRKGKELWEDSNYVKNVMMGRERAKSEGKYQYSEEERKMRSVRASGDNNPAKRPEVRAKNSGENHYSKREGYVLHSCIHCGLTTTLANITRWHNDNCKYKN